MAAFEGIVGREPYPVADKAGEILERLSRFGVTRFRALFKGNRSRSESCARGKPQAERAAEHGVPGHAGRQQPDHQVAHVEVGQKNQ